MKIEMNSWIFFSFICLSIISVLTLYFVGFLKNYQGKIAINLLINQFGISMNVFVFRLLQKHNPELILIETNESLFHTLLEDNGN